jgi:hypothetical protein
MSIPCITHQDKSRRSKNSLVKLVKVVRGGVAGSDTLVVDSPLELVAPAKKGRLLYRQVDVLLYNDGLKIASGRFMRWS